MGLTTTTAGWFPKPAAVRRARWLHAEGEIDDDTLARAARDATREAIALQATVGIDLPDDGQMDRGDLVGDLADRFDGVERGAPVRIHGNRYYRRPRIVDELRRTGAAVSAGWRWAAEDSAVPPKAVLTGPYTLMDWSFDEHYRSREGCCEALAALLRDDMSDLLDAGATEIQLDEPAIGARPEEWPLVLRALAHVVEPARGRARISVHLFYRDLGVVADRLHELPGDGLMLETTQGGGAALERIAPLPDSKLLTVGVIDVEDERVEDVDAVRRRIEHALTLQGAERLRVAPDAGLHGLAPATARAKLERMVAAARSF